MERNDSWRHFSLLQIFTAVASNEITLISSCQNLQNIPANVMQCPWRVFPSPLPVAINAGFEILLVWNGSASGTQVSSQFGVFNASLPIESSSATKPPPTKTIISSTAHSSLLSSTPAIVSQPSALSQAEHAISEKIGLGVGLGIGTPLGTILVATVLFLCRRRSRKRTEDATELPQRSGKLPPHGASRLAKASWNPLARNLETPELLANYRNAEHFGFMSTPINR